MRAAGVCVVDAAVDTMVLTYSLAFPADSKLLASGLDVKVVRDHIAAGVCAIWLWQ